MVVNDKTGLVIGAGAFRAAFATGVLLELEKVLPKEEVEKIFTSSSGSLLGVAYAVDQLDALENAFASRISRDRIVNPWHVFGKHGMINIYGLTGYFDQDQTMDGLKEPTSPELSIVVTDLKDGSDHYVSQFDNFEELRTAFLATQAVPLIHKPVEITIDRYTFNGIDGALGTVLPVRKALEDEDLDHVIAISNYPPPTPEGYKSEGFHKLLQATAILDARYRRIKEVIDDYQNHLNRLEDYITKSVDEGRLTILRPNEPLALDHVLDIDQVHLNQTVEQGRVVGRRFAFDYTSKKQRNDDTL